MPLHVCVLLLSVIGLALAGCGDFEAFDWTRLSHLPVSSPPQSTTEVEQVRAAPDDQYAPIPGREQQYRWTTEGPVQEGIRLVVYESAQRGWQVRDGFWSLRTVKVLLGSPKTQLTSIAVVDAYTLFMTNHGQLMAFDHRAEHFCRRAILADLKVRLLFPTAATRTSAESTTLIVGDNDAGPRHELDLRWLCEQAAAAT
jgi:hypothetical protein